ncbi:MAG: copper-translocating P-type ATPase [Ignavibacteriales bacterium]|nr:copper-translocating P-type ATPase [Ignavibacteriales bacterium]
MNENKIYHNFPIKGMTCASCVARVEKVLSKMEGIENVKVNYASEKVSFDTNNKNIDLKQAADKLEKFGYQLELTDVKSKPGEKPREAKNEKNHFTNDFKIALLFTIPIFLISMISNMSSSWPISQDYTNKILLILTTPVLFIPGKNFFTIFWTNLKHFSFEMNSLVAIGTGAAFTYSAVATLFPKLVQVGESLPHVYFDTSAVIITLILMGKMLEERAKRKTNSALKKLLELKPKTATVIIDGKEQKINLFDLELRNHVVVKPGEKIPADGKIIEGYSTVDESMITGESIPIEKSLGANVIGGTINKNGTFVFEVSALGDNSVLGQIIKMVEEAQGSKAPIQNLADKVAAVFVPSVIVISISTFIGWMIFGGENSFVISLINAVAVLIIACPCALGLATPTAIMVGTELGASNGILIKNGESLEIAHKLDTIVLDKTGTITEGKPNVTEVITNDFDKSELLKIVNTIEQRSQHPIAEAIIEYCKKENIEILKLDSFENLDGFGIEAKIGSDEYLVGNQKLLENNSVNTEKLESEYHKYTEEGKSIVFVAKNNKLAGLISVADQVKETSAEAVKNFKEQNLNVIMISGDNEKTAKAIAEKVGIEKYFAEVRPENKAKIVKELQGKNHTVAMVGDGINDAPALVQADLGIAIGTGTDVAIESSDITLIKGDLMKVNSAIKVSQRTIRTIKQNLFWAFIYNIIGIPLATAGILNPMLGALAMSFSSVSVISNSLRLKKAKINF